MKLTENQLEEIQTKVSEATSDAFRKTILEFVNKYNKSKRDKNKREAICSLCHRKNNRENYSQ